MVVHYARPRLRAACGRAKPARITTSRNYVTCEKCKGTLKFKTDWFAQVDQSVNTTDSSRSGRPS